MIKKNEIENFRSYLREINRGFGILKNDPFDVGLSLSQSHVLVELEIKNTLTNKEISEVLNLEKSTVTRIVKSLEKKQLISIRVDRQDKRVKNIKILNKGLDKLGKIKVSANHSVSEVFSKMTIYDIKKSLKSFSLIARALKRAK